MRLHKQQTPPLNLLSLSSRSSWVTPLFSLLLQQHYYWHYQPVRMVFIRRAPRCSKLMRGTMKSSLQDLTTPRYVLRATHRPSGLTDEIRSWSKPYPSVVISQTPYPMVQILRSLVRPLSEPQASLRESCQEPERSC